MNNIIDKTIKNYRYERKFHLTSLSFDSIEHIVSLHPAAFSEVFEERSVNNIYFDTNSLANYFDNLDGVAKRKKTRIRWYGGLFGLIKDPILEFKIKYGLVGKKLSYQVGPFNLYSHYKDSVLNSFDLFGHNSIPKNIKRELENYNPMLINSYKRKYFLSGDKKFRLTLDRNLMFYKTDKTLKTSGRISDDNSIIMELKYDESNDLSAEKITNLFPFRVTKSSKYIMGIQATLAS
ncbi:MAG: polyphosphate polymerase domain-containing protein [Gammaproteobacteria bacterium]|nr:polyphosphate polymerase domain-containing protein [Gammaproteobacteria bacterium]|tara:strand:+ start:148 stop:852 length:705 start_codon:yes stop_codon:yes gene_type:complete